MGPAQICSSRPETLVFDSGRRGAAILRDLPQLQLGCRVARWKWLLPAANHGKLGLASRRSDPRLHGVSKRRCIRAERRPAAVPGQRHVRCQPGLCRNHPDSGRPEAKARIETGAPRTELRRRLSAFYPGLERPANLRRHEIHYSPRGLEYRPSRVQAAVHQARYIRRRDRFIARALGRMG